MENEKYFSHFERKIIVSYKKVIEQLIQTLNS